MGKKKTKSSKLIYKIMAKGEKFLSDIDYGCRYLIVDTIFLRSLGYRYININFKNIE